MPNLGVVVAGDERLAIADVPGLIPGAHQGKGLGLEFLRHVERCSVLVHVIDCATLEPGRDPMTDLDVIEEELAQYVPDNSLGGRPLAELRDDPRLELAVTVDSAATGWDGHVGVVTTLIDDLDFDPAATVALICGPEVMMRFAAQSLIGRGVAAADLHVSMERNMKCAVTQCGRCQFGPTFVCREGAVMRYGDIERIFNLREI